MGMSNSGDRTTVERITIEIPDEAAAQLREAAEHHGRSFEAEVLDRATRDLARERAERIRAMTPKEFIAHIVSVANGADFEPPERWNVPEDREIFGAD
jgi:antitoxin FitA